MKENPRTCIITVKEGIKIASSIPNPVSPATAKRPRYHPPAASHTTTQVPRASTIRFHRPCKIHQTMGSSTNLAQFRLVTQPSLLWIKWWSLQGFLQSKSCSFRITGICLKIVFFPGSRSFTLATKVLAFNSTTKSITPAR